MSDEGSSASKDRNEPSDLPDESGVGDRFSETRELKSLSHDLRRMKDHKKDGKKRKSKNSELTSDGGKHNHEVDSFDEGSDSIQDIEFQFEKTGEALESYIEDIADTVRIGLDQSIAILTPWFFSNMPRMYYQTTPRAEKVRHLSAVITGHVFETKQTVELWDHNHTKVTYIGPGSDRQILIGMAKKVSGISTKMGSLYFSRDKLLFLSTFFCSEYKKADRNNKHIISKINMARDLIATDFQDLTTRIDIDNYIDNLDHDFVVYATPSRLQITFRMLYHMLSHEGAHTIIEPYENSASGRLTVGLKGVDSGEILEQVFHLMYRYGFEIVRFFSVQFIEGYPEGISVLHFVIKHSSGAQLNTSNVQVIRLIKALRTLGWVDSDQYNMLMVSPCELSINGSNLIRGIATWVHILLGKENIYYYSEYKIFHTLMAYPGLTKEISVLFRHKFDPRLEKERALGLYETVREALKEKVEELIDRVERLIFREAVKFIDHSLKTNYFIPTKTGLAFRLAPEILDPKYYPNKPFGIFFILGRDYRFFQVRWKNVARGGLRVVMPGSMTDYGYAISGIFDEVYGLSHAQQLKNKDIPEGGSKAVMVVRPEGNKERSVRGGINALLDLLVSEDETHEQMSSRLVSYYKDEEIIYLGPDENMTNDLIEWVPTHAQRRGYQYAAAFMSSKPGAGINHKEFGVTSEGLHVFVDQTLNFLGINPHEQKFTIKITGGPDGDVAGNELKILYREYGANARVVAIADGQGAAYDPDGLDWDELLSLTEKGLSICEFDSLKLGKHKSSFVISADTTENIRRRNELHAVINADLFIPAGGRPYTVNDHNWERFISEDGLPSCRAVIEGANIFFTKEARTQLQRRGVLMIKDSSANKTGVICSSFEIIASLILSVDEFKAIKKQYVSQVVAILREKARKEAKLLFSEFSHRRGQKDLVDLSLNISLEINKITDTLLDEFLKNKEIVLQDPLHRDLILHHCPAVLRHHYADRILTQLPDAHQIAILASFIASHIVYQEGLGWLDSIGEGKRYFAAMTYMKNERQAMKLIENISQSNLENKDNITSVLARSAARDLTMLTLEEGKNDHESNRS